LQELVVVVSELTTDPEYHPYYKQP